MYNQREKNNDRAPDPEEQHPVEPQQLRRNPRIVIGSLDFFEMLMEQEEQQ